MPIDSHSFFFQATSAACAGATNGFISDLMLHVPVMTSFS